MFRLSKHRISREDGGLSLFAHLEIGLYDLSNVARQPLPRNRILFVIFCRNLFVVFSPRPDRK